MTSFFAPYTVTVVINPDNRVVVRRLNTGEANSIKSRYVRSQVAAKVTPGSRQAPEDADAVTTIDSTNMTLETLVASIVSWEGPGFYKESTTELAPISREFILKLPEFVTDKVIEAINELGGGLSEEGKSRLTAPTNGTT